MDIYCPTCGEPWDFNSLHEEAAERYGIPYYQYDSGLDFGYKTKTLNPDYVSEDYQKVFSQVSKEFRVIGCKALKSFGPHEYCKKTNANPETDRIFGLTRSEASSALYDILGDDMDGAAAMLDDMGF